MNKFIKTSLIVSIIILFALSLPNVYSKHQAENSQNQVELTVDFRHMYLSTKKAGDEFQENMVQVLKNNGITSVGFTENSLKELEAREKLHVLKGTELEKQLWNEKLNFKITRNYTYVVVPNTEYQDEIVQTIGDSQVGRMTIYRTNDTLLLELDAAYSTVYREPLLFLESDFEKLSEQFNIVPRISNGWDQRLPLVIEQLEKFDAISPLSPVVFMGREVEGYNKEDTITNELWNEIGIGMIEIFNVKDKQLGSEKYAYSSNFNIVRVHSLPKERFVKNTGDELKRLVVKAANERNIRMFYINLPFYDETKDENEFFELLDDKLSSIYYGLNNNGYELGISVPFKQNETALNKVSVISSIFGAFLLFVLAVYRLFENTLFLEKKGLFYLLIGSGLVGILFILIDGEISFLNQVASLGITILLPIWASFELLTYLDGKHVVKKDNLIHMFLPLVTLFAVGLTFLTSMNFDLMHITNTKGFKGVSLTLLIPIGVVGAYLILKFKNVLSIKDVLKHKIRVIDALVLVSLLVFFVFYISRSGNAGSLLPFEAQIRNWLEDALNVRPRSKEIFFAFPIMTIMIVLWRQHKWVRLLLPIATLGMASIFNTFTHFHTPIYISLTRTLISVGIGAAIGMIISMVVLSILKYQNIKKV